MIVPLTQFYFHRSFKIVPLHLRLGQGKLGSECHTERKTESAETLTFFEMTVMDCTHNVSSRVVGVQTLDIIAAHIDRLGTDQLL